MIKLENLVKIDLSQNAIHFLPEKMGELSKLKFLHLEHNELVGK